MGQHFLIDSRILNRITGHVHAVNGVSLTVVEAAEDSFTVSLVRFTYENTDLGEIRPGDPLNLEIDILAKYTERLLQGERGNDLTRSGGETHAHN